MIELKLIDFDQIYDIWTNKLWPNRQTPIKSMSSMLFMGGYDMNIYQLYKPTFFGLFDNDKIIGVNSCHSTSDTDFRLRGLWVNPEYQGQGLGKKLINAVVEEGRKQNKKMVWSLPRKGTSFYAHSKVGFVQFSEWFDENVEFGPNCYMKIEL